jgi:hypothetical protein
VAGSNKIVVNAASGGDSPCCARFTDSRTRMACRCRPQGDTSDREVVLRDCGADHAEMRRVLCELREAVLEQVGKVRQIGCVARSQTL